MKKLAIAAASLAVFSGPAFAATVEENLDKMIQSFIAAGCEAADEDALKDIQAASGLSEDDFGAGFVMLMMKEQIVEGSSGGPRLVHPDCK